MTIALASATKDVEGRTGFWFCSDARLVVGSPPRNVDTFVKTIELTERVGLLVAGSTLSLTAAAEIVRTLVSAHNRARPAERVSFFDTARLFAHFARQLHSSAHPDADANAVLCGFYRDGAPGLIHLRLREGDVQCFRPRAKERATVVIGDERLRSLVSYAVLHSRRFAKSEKDGFLRVLSLLYTIIKHEGTPYASVGGGIAYGFSIDPDAPLSWPLISLEGETFYRGLAFDVLRGDGSSPPIILELNQQFADFIERQYETEKSTEPFVHLPDVPRCAGPISGFAQEHLLKPTRDPDALRFD